MSSISPPVRTILIIDDNVGLARLLKRQLKKEGFQVVSVSNGSDALSWLQENHPDLVLLDLDLPDHMGEQVVKDLVGRTRAAPFIVVTTHGGERRAVEMMKRGALDYLMKDATLLELLPAVVEQALDQVERTRKLRDAEFQLEHLRRHYELILNAVGEGVCGLDLDGRINFINPAGLRMVGFEVNELLGQDIAVLADRPTAGAPGIKETVVGHSTFRNATHLFWRKDGTSFPIEYTSTPIREAGRQVGSVFVFRDVTRRFELEEQVRHGQKLEAVGRLAGGIAHDFNNVLTVISGYADLLNKNTDLDSKTQNKVSALHEAVQRAIGLTRQLLAFGQQQSLRPMSVHLPKFFGNIRGNLQRIIGGNTVLAVDCEPTTSELTIDPHMLELVFVNLATRAREGMANGGRFSIRAGNLTLRSNSLERPQAVSPGEYVCISVNDSGLPLSKHDLAHAFDPFFPSPENRSSSGLGLATAYGIILQSGGHIDVCSSQQTGTTFRLLIPQAMLSQQANINNGAPSVMDDHAESAVQ